MSSSRPPTLAQKRSGDGFDKMIENPMKMLAMLAFFTASLVPSTARSASSSTGASAWIVPWDAPADLSGREWSCFNEINPFVYAFNKDKEISLVYPKLLEQAERSRPEGTLLIPVIVNDLFGSESKVDTLKSIGLLTKLLSRRGRLEKHAEEIAKLVEEKGFDGIEIDYERIPPPLWGRFIEFNAKLGSLLHAKGKRLNVGLEGGLLHRMGGVIPRRYWSELAKSVDLIKLMCYYERGYTDPAGPGNSKEWVVDTVKRALTVIPAEKLSVSLSLAGMEWTVPSSKVKRIHYFQVQNHLRRPGAKERWDELRSSPVLEFEDNGVRHEIWFENERSLAEKTQAVREAGARHVSFWYIGSRHPQIAQLGLCPTSSPAR